MLFRSHGGSVAAPVARKIVDAYFHLKKERTAPKIAPAVPDDARDEGRKQPDGEQQDVAREDEGGGEDE